jgi:hypothetical protein
MAAAFSSTHSRSFIFLSLRFWLYRDRSTTETLQGTFMRNFIRRMLQRALYNQWRRTLTRGERVRLDYWGATGNPAHHEFSWAE